jgi:hypothetical protein
VAEPISSTNIIDQDFEIDAIRAGENSKARKLVVPTDVKADLTRIG